MNTLVRLLKNILELIGVLFKYVFSKIEDTVGILLLGRKENSKLKRAVNSWRENIVFPKEKKRLENLGVDKSPVSSGAPLRLPQENH